MKIFQKYMLAQVLRSVFFTLMVLLALFAFFDLIGQLSDLGKGQYQLLHVFLYVLFTLPGRLYELFPIAVLIGTLFALGQMVVQSEYAVLRAAGVSSWQIWRTLAYLGLGFAGFTFVVGEYVAPEAERFATQLRLRSQGQMVAQEFRSGLWMKDGSSFINAREVMPDNTVRDLRVYVFDEQYQLQRTIEAKQAHPGDNQAWKLQQVTLTEFLGSHIQRSVVAEYDWHSVLSPALLSVLLVPPENMSLQSLRIYVEHLRNNHQQSARHEVALWGKAVFPLVNLVMLLLALPFAQVQQRQGGLGSRIFVGIVLGLGFYLLNKLSAYFGPRYDWPSWLAALLPSTLVLTAALSMLRWQERR